MNAWPNIVLRQDVQTPETRTAAMAALLENVPSRPVSIEALPQLILQHGLNALPVGSVEFVRSAIFALGLKEPTGLSYPEELSAYFARSIRPVEASEVIGGKWGRVFIKPVQTKLFNGFVFDPAAPTDALDEHDFEQRQVLERLPDDTPLWCSEPVEFMAEWRYYVVDGQVMACARYDPDGPDGVEEPDAFWVRGIVKKFLEHRDVSGFALDVGRLSNGTPCLVEINDGWSLGLYGRSADARSYLRLLWLRWKQIASS